MKYVAAINMDDFDAHKQRNTFVAIERRVLNPTFCRLLCVPAASAPVERVFPRRPRHNKPRRARMGDELLEMLIHLCCSCR